MGKQEALLSQICIEQDSDRTTISIKLKIINGSLAKLILAPVKRL